jgi:hypothetical protein
LMVSMVVPHLSACVVERRSVLSSDRTHREHNAGSVSGRGSPVERGRTIGCEGVPDRRIQAGIGVATAEDSAGAEQHAAWSAGCPLVEMEQWRGSDS